MTIRRVVPKKRGILDSGKFLYYFYHNIKLNLQFSIMIVQKYYYFILDSEDDELVDYAIPGPSNAPGNMLLYSINNLIFFRLVVNFHN